MTHPSILTADADQVERQMQNAVLPATVAMEPRPFSHSLCNQLPHYATIFWQHFNKRINMLRNTNEEQLQWQNSAMMLVLILNVTSNNDVGKRVKQILKIKKRNHR